MWSEANQLHPLKWFTVRNNKKNPRRHGWLPMQSSIDNTCIVLHARFFFNYPCSLSNIFIVLHARTLFQNKINMKI